MKTSAETVIGLPQEMYEDLRATAEHRVLTHGERVKGMELYAPFVDLNDQSRLVINGDMQEVYYRKCVAGIYGFGQSMLLDVDVAEGLMGRPLLSPDKDGVSRGYFGDIEGETNYDAFSLHLYSGGLTTLAGRQEGKTCMRALAGIAPDEAHAFGRAVLFGIDKRITKETNELIIKQREES